MTVVFLSHSNADHQARDRARAVLEEAGAEVIIVGPQNNEPGSDWVQTINAGLERADVVLVLWSRAAASSRWVNKELHISVARVMDGRLKRLALARLDDEAEPAVTSADQWYDLTTEDGWSTLRGLVQDPGTLDLSDTLGRRFVRRQNALIQVEDLIDFNDAVMVLAPGGAGRQAFAHQLADHLETRNAWWVPIISTSRQPNEGDDDYWRRFTRRLSLDGARADRVVVILVGWSRHGVPREELSRRLRQYQERQSRRTFRIVAIGGGELPPLKEQGDASAFNTAFPYYLPDLRDEEVEALFAVGDPPAFAPAEVHRVMAVTGGRASLVGLAGRMLGRDRDRGRALDFETLENRVADWAHSELKAVFGPATDAAAKVDLPSVLAACLQDHDGVRNDSHSPARDLLYFRGLLKRNAKSSVLLCSAVERAVRGYLESLA